MHNLASDHKPFCSPLCVNLILCSLAFLVLQIFQDDLLFKREKILTGDYWRLLTGNLVHTNYNHLALNLAGVWLLYYLFIEHLTVGLFYSLLLLLSLAVGLGLWWFSPATEWYAGVSGALYGMYFAMGCIALYKRDYWSGLPVVLLIVGKLLTDEFWPDLAQTNAELIEAPVLTFSHVLGVGGAAIYCLLALGYKQLHTPSRSS